MEIDGLPELHKRLENIGKGKPLLRKLQSDTALEAKRLVPRKTTTLARSIKPGYLTDTEALVKATAAYAAYVEIGTGIYGPKRKPIVPRNANVLAWRTGKVTLAGKSRVKGGKELAGWAFARSVKGRPATPYLVPGAKKAVEKNGLRDVVIELWNEGA
jgi:hypothetical protein